MCRKAQLRGSLVLGIGLGLLIGHYVESWFVCTCGGIALVFLGFAWLKDK